MISRPELIERVAEPVALIHVAHALGLTNLRDLQLTMRRAGIGPRRWTRCGVPIIEARRR